MKKKIFYQPTTCEVEHLWTAIGANHPHYPKFQQAQDLLVDINARMAVRNGKISLYDQHSQSLRQLSGNGDECTCSQFLLNPYIQPRPFRRDGPQHCAHTLAWAGYVRILRGYYQRLWTKTPVNLAAGEQLIRGEYHLLNAKRWLEFAVWLRNHQIAIPVTTRETYEIYAKP